MLGYYSDEGATREALVSVGFTTATSASWMDDGIFFGGPFQGDHCRHQRQECLPGRARGGLLEFAARERTEHRWCPMELAKR